MQGQERIERVLLRVGVIDRVDTVNREVAVFVDGKLMTFDVPIGCKVILHGEPVKLRMVQPLDRVRITHVIRRDLCVARAIEVQPDEIARHLTRAPGGGQSAGR